MRLLWERSRVLRRWRDIKEGGNEPEKKLWLRKSDLRLMRAERLGIGPESELFWRLRTRSWSS